MEGIVLTVGLLIILYGLGRLILNLYKGRPAWASVKEFAARLLDGLSG